MKILSLGSVRNAQIQQSTYIEHDLILVENMDDSSCKSKAPLIENMHRILNKGRCNLLKICRFQRMMALLLRLYRCSCTPGLFNKRKLSYAFRLSVLISVRMPGVIVHITYLRRVRLLDKEPWKKRVYTKVSFFSNK